MKRAANGKAKEESSSEEEEESSEEESEEEEAAPAPAAKKQKDNNGSAIDVSAANGSRTIFIKNLAWAADENAIREFFESAGPIVSVRIATDRETGRARGFAHIQFEEIEGAAAAIAMSDQEFLGRQVFINSAEEREQRPQRTWRRCCRVFQWVKGLCSAACCAHACNPFATGQAATLCSHPTVVGVPSLVGTYPSRKRRRTMGPGCRHSCLPGVHES